MEGNLHRVAFNITKGSVAVSTGHKVIVWLTSHISPDFGHYDGDRWAMFWWMGLHDDVRFIHVLVAGSNMMILVSFIHHNVAINQSRPHTCAASN